MKSLRVRRLTEQDVKEVEELIDDDTAKLTDLQVPFMLTNAFIFVNTYRTYGCWSNSKLIGAFELKSDGEVSYLVHKDYRKQNVATEMLKLAKRVARKDFQLNTLYCVIKDDNIPSIRTAEKLGFNVYHGK
jgi:RimJ/RimL family protein N-acetyltransferase